MNDNINCATAIMQVLKNRRGQYLDRHTSVSVEEFPGVKLILLAQEVGNHGFSTTEINTTIRALIRDKKVELTAMRYGYEAPHQPYQRRVVLELRSIPSYFSATASVALRLNLRGTPLSAKQMAKFGYQHYIAGPPPDEQPSPFLHLNGFMVREVDAPTGRVALAV